MFLRPHHRDKDGKRHTYGSLVETIRTADGPRQRTLCHFGELNDSAQARWLKTIEVFNEAGERHQLKLFPSNIAPPPDDAEVAQVLIQRVRVERTRQLGPALLGLALWRQRRLDEFFETRVDAVPADVPWSRGAAILAINRLCAPGSELAIEERWYPPTVERSGSGGWRPPRPISSGSSTNSTSPSPPTSNGMPNVVQTL